MVITVEGNRDKEIELMNNALRSCGSPDSALTKGAVPLQPHDHTNRETGKITCHITIRIAAGSSRTNFNLGNTVWQLLVCHKHPVKKEEICGAVYRISYEGGQEEEECHSFYVG